MKNSTRLLFAASAVFVLSSATAQAVTVPKSVEPGRAQQQIAPLQSPGKADGAGGVGGKAAVEAPAGSEKVKLTLSDIKIEGVSAYDDAELKALYADKIGKTISLADVYGIANTLTAKYRNDGYILSQVVVPPQTIEGGHIKLRVVEGFANDIRIEGETNGSLRDLQPYVDKIRAAKPFSSKVLERNLLLINDLPGITARSVLSPSKVAGATDIVIVVSRKPYDVFFQVDNRGTRFLGPLQFNTGIRLNNMFGTYEGISFQYATAPFYAELNYGSVSVTEPIGSAGTILTFGGSMTRTRPGYTLKTFDVKGQANAFNVEVMHPFIRSRSENLSTALRFDHLNSKRTDNATAAAIRDVLSVLRANATYQLIDSLAGANSAMLEISRGFDIMGSTGGGNVNTTRPGAENKFTKGVAEVSRLQRVSDHFDIFVSGKGQLSANKLFTSEQFGLGGAAYGSAYDPSELTGDDGIAGRAELRLNNTAAALPVENTQFYSFYDIGKVWDPGNTVVADREVSLASAGAGVRLSVNKNVSGSVEVAKPLTRSVATMNGRSPRFFGALTAKF